MDLGDDDELMDVGKFKKALSKDKGRQPKEVTQIVQGLQQRVLAQNQWVSSRPDVNDVSQFIAANNLNQDQEILALQTDPVGQYYLVRDRMNEKRIADLERQLKGLKTGSKKKSKVPPTSGKGASTRKKTRDDLGKMEGTLLNFMKRTGNEPRVR